MVTQVSEQELDIWKIGEIRVQEFRSKVKFGQCFSGISFQRPLLFENDQRTKVYML